MHGYLLQFLATFVIWFTTTNADFFYSMNPTPRSRIHSHSHIDTSNSNLYNRDRIYGERNITIEVNRGHHDPSHRSPTPSPTVSRRHNAYDDRISVNPNRGLESANQQRQESSMVFPTDLEESHTGAKRNSNANRLNEIKPSNCSFGLCDDVEDYPDDKIKILLSRSTELKQYFNQLNLVNISFANRNKFDEDEETLCVVKTHTRFPKSAKNVNNMDKILVNVDGHKQGIVFETCGIDGGSCKFAEFLPQGYASSCKQKYVVRRLMVLGKEEQNEKLVFDSFEIPSCCVCSIRKMT